MTVERLRLVYLSGPMTGLPESNRPTFHAAARELAARDIVVLNPARHPDGWSRSIYMRHAVADILRVANFGTGGSVVRLPGWKSADGARFEVGLAMRLGVSVLDLEALLRFPVVHPECRGPNVVVSPARSP